MASFSLTIGKGLREPCSPGRRAYFFGAELNAVSADGWNCLPSIDGSTSSYDLSGLTKNHEVVVALLNISNVGQAAFRIRFRWYRRKDGAMIYEYVDTRGAARWDWVYSYSYIGWVDWEINEDGEYYVEVDVSGDISYSRSLIFTVTGVSEVPEEAPELPSIRGEIVGLLSGVSNFFYSIYVEVYGWVWPFNEAAVFFWAASSYFAQLAFAAQDFITWVEGVAAQTVQVLSWDTIWDLIIERVPFLMEIAAWFDGLWDYVLSVVNTWWTSTTVEVRGWIDTAVQSVSGFTATWNTFWNWVWPVYQDRVNGLRASWDNFWEETYPELLTLDWIDTWWDTRVHDVQSLINSGIAGIMPMINSWQEIRTDVLTFFQDPVEYIWERFTDWFLGPEA